MGIFLTVEEDHGRKRIAGGTMRVLTRDEVTERVGIGRTTLWRWERDGRFPRRRQLGPSRVGWLESEVEAWMRSRPPVGSEEAADVGAGSDDGREI